MVSKEEQFASYLNKHLTDIASKGIGLVCFCLEIGSLVAPAGLKLIL